MKLNTSRVIEVFYRGHGEPVEVYPRFNIDEGMVNSPNAHCLAKGLTLLDQMRRKPDSGICFYRTFALGDILLLTPIFNWLKDEYPACKIYLATASGFLGLFRYWDVVTTVDKRYVLDTDYDVGYYLDGIVERDHEGNEYSHKHRLQIYCDFLGIPVPKDPLFSLPYGENERTWAESIISNLRSTGKPIIAMQVFGSTSIKRLPIEKVMKISGELSKNYSLVWVHNNKAIPEIPDVLDLSGRTSIHQLAALIDLVDAVISMDSGILWVAHCTSTPIIALLGATREEERLLYHRNYYVVNLSKMIGCDPCFERTQKCQGRINCMTQSDENEIIKEIENAIKKLSCS